MQESCQREQKPAGIHFLHFKPTVGLVLHALFSSGGGRSPESLLHAAHQTSFLQRTDLSDIFAFQIHEASDPSCTLSSAKFLLSTLPVGQDGKGGIVFLTTVFINLDAELLTILKFPLNFYLNLSTHLSFLSEKLCDPVVYLSWSASGTNVSPIASWMPFSSLMLSMAPRRRP